MPIEIEGVEYFSAADIHRTLRIARQTLWRWRKSRKIPQGRRYCDVQIVFARQKLEVIRGYANRLELADSSTRQRPREDAKGGRVMPASLRLRDQTKRATR